MPYSGLKVGFRRVDGNAIMLGRSGNRHIALADIVDDAVARPLAWVAIAVATTGQYVDLLAGFTSAKMYCACVKKRNARQCAARRLRWRQSVMQYA